MLATLKTYGNKETKVSFIISYSTDGKGATFSLFSADDGLTVELTSADLRALSQAVSEAQYAHAEQF